MKYKYEYNSRYELISNLRWKNKNKKKNIIYYNTILRKKDFNNINFDMILRKNATKIEYLLSKAFKYFWRKNFLIKKLKRKKIKKKKLNKNIYKSFLKILRKKKFKKKFLRRKINLKFKRIKRIEKIINKNVEQRTKIIKTCVINLKHTFSNFFIVVSDLEGKVIGYCSSGQVCESSNIKKKKSYFLVNSMMNRLILKLNKLNIKNVRVRIRSNITQHIRKVIYYLKNGGFRIQHIFFVKPIPHHFGQRRKKLRRL